MMNVAEKVIIEQQIHIAQKDKKKDKIKIYDIFKRCVDIIAGLLGCLCLIPLSLIIKVMNLLLGDNQSIFYVQKRIGKNGKEFKLYKYRTMEKNADRKLRKILKENEKLRIEYEKNKKIKNDPRITSVGKFLRRTSLDEVPQFINILKGDMSLIGNRPYLLREKKEMGKYFNVIVKTKPGLTGLWQTSGRSNISFNERLMIENEYSKKYSLKMDVKIIIKTIVEVFKCRGAI